MADRPYLTAQQDVINAMMRGVQHLKSIADDPQGNADDYDYAFAEFFASLTNITEYSISTKGFTGLTDMRSGGFMANICGRTAKVFRAPHARLSFGGTSLAMMMLVGVVLPQWVDRKRRSILLTDNLGHQCVLGGSIIGQWDVVKIERDTVKHIGVSKPLTLRLVRAAVEANGPHNIAALVYNPMSYDGFRNRKEELKIFAYCRKHGIKVIADMAWSSVYSIVPDQELQGSLLDFCDACCTSPHKRSLFPSSVSIALFREQQRAEQFTEAGRLGWATTSPAFATLMLVDFRLVQIESGLVAKQLAIVEAISRNLRTCFDELSPHLRVVKASDVGADYQDPAHILVSSARSDIDCRTLIEWLSENSYTDWEKANRQTGLFLVSNHHRNIQSQIIDDLAEAINAIQTQT
ncbi:MAG: hypothetical protein COA91_13875 [Robiginitomaculum sp.]|nr:MAG: hypothetical protein COA91_13875 [Robiginitomaculum sp.]